MYLGIEPFNFCFVLFCFLFFWGLSAVTVVAAKSSTRERKLYLRASYDGHGSLIHLGYYSQVHMRQRALITLVFVHQFVGQLSALPRLCMAEFCDKVESLETKIATQSRKEKNIPCAHK